MDTHVKDVDAEKSSMVESLQIVCNDVEELSKLLTEKHEVLDAFSCFKMRHHLDDARKSVERVKEVIDYVVNHPRNKREG